jgi:hypothetical protein
MQDGYCLFQFTIYVQSTKFIMKTIMFILKYHGKSCQRFLILQEILALMIIRMYRCLFVTVTETPVFVFLVQILCFDGATYTGSKLNPLRHSLKKPFLQGKTTGVWWVPDTSPVNQGTHPKCFTPFPIHSTNFWRKFVQIILINYKKLYPPICNVFRVYINRCIPQWQLEKN